LLRIRSNGGLSEHVSNIFGFHNSREDHTSTTFHFSHIYNMYNIIPIHVSTKGQNIEKFGVQVEGNGP